MSQPIRCFDGVAKPHEPFWAWRNADVSESGEPEMLLYGHISEYSWYEDDVTPKLFKDDLYRVGNKGPVTVRINSGGGDVVAASLMRATLMDYPGRVTTRVDGMAASAAVAVMLAGDRVKIQDTAYVMIHDPAIMVMLAVLDINTLGGLLDQLKTVKSGIMAAYADKTKLSTDKLGRMMSAETWMTAAEAKEFGFVDEIISGGKKASAKAYVNILRNYQHVPVALLDEQGETEAEATEPEPEAPEGATTPDEPTAEVDASEGAEFTRLEARRARLANLH